MVREHDSLRGHSYVRHAQTIPDLLRESRRAVAASDGASAVGLSPAEPDVEQPASTRLESRAPETSAIVRSFIGSLFAGTAERFDARSDEAGAQNCGHDRFVFDGRQSTETDWGSVASGPSTRSEPRHCLGSIGSVTTTSSPRSETSPPIEQQDPYPRENFTGQQPLPGDPGLPLSPGRYSPSCATQPRAISAGGPPRAGSALSAASRHAACRQRGPTPSCLLSGAQGG